MKVVVLLAVLGAMPACDECHDGEAICDGTHRMSARMHVSPPHDRAYCTDGSTCSGSDQATCDDPNAILGCIAGQHVAMACNPSSDCEDVLVISTGATEAECVYREQ